MPANPIPEYSREHYGPILAIAFPAPNAVLCSLHDAYDKHEWYAYHVDVPDESRELGFTAMERVCLACGKRQRQQLIYDPDRPGITHTWVNI